MNRVMAILCMAGLLTSAHAGTDEKVLKVGDRAPAWVDLPGIDGKKHSLADLKEKEVVVLVFTCNSCGQAEAYEDRIIAFAKKNCGPDQKVALIAINVNTIPEDRMPKMQERAKKKGFTFPYLYDETQKIAYDYSAMVTPEFFVLGKDRKLVYRGLMDDRMVESLVKVNYLDAAVQAALKGEKPAVERTVGRGCKIRFLRKKD